MSVKLYKLTITQFNVLDWDQVQSVSPDNFKNYPSIINKIQKSKPLQVAKFLKYNISVDSIKTIGVRKVRDLFKVAGEGNIKHIIGEVPEYMFFSEFQWDLSFISTYANVLDLSHVYTQCNIPNSFLKNYIDRIDVISAIQYFYIRQPERLKYFIDSNREKIQEAIELDINSARLPDEIFSKYGLKKACSPESV